MENVKVYLICGKARTGKNTVAGLIRQKLESKGNKVCEIQIMRTVKSYAKDYFNWDGKDETKPRKLLQEMGTELIREKMNMPFFHLDRLTGDIKILSNFFDTFIVDDIRLKEEIEVIRERFKNVTVILVEKNNILNNLTEEEQKHSTENDLNDYNSYDYKINNDEEELLDSKVDSILFGGK